MGREAQALFAHNPVVVVEKDPTGAVIVLQLKAPLTPLPFRSHFPGHGLDDDQVPPGQACQSAVVDGKADPMKARRAERPLENRAAGTLPINPPMEAERSSTATLAG